MSINFKMWGKALAGLVKMDSKQEWAGLDIVSKWLIATRSAVTTVTLYSCADRRVVGLAGRLFRMAALDHYYARAFHRPRDQ